MKKLPGLFKFPVFVLPFILLLFLSMNIVHAQEAVAIPGPEIEEAGFIQVKELNIGDVVFVKSETGDLIPNTITKLQYQQEPVEVYNLSVAGEETFFANDFAVHNKFGSHNAVCDVTLAPKLSIAPTETWSISTKGQAFRNLFQYKFAFDSGNNICLWGSVINGCQYPPRKVLPTYVDEDGKTRCAYYATPCCGCDKAYGTNCSSGGCNPQCEMTCGTWGTGHAAGSDRIRFRSAFLFCDGCGCGAAVKVTAPSGYIIKSITADITSRMACSADPKICGNLYFSRGMGWSLECSMKPYAVHYMVPSQYDGRLTVGLGGGTKYFFIYHHVTSAGVDDRNWVGVDLRDNWAELSNIELKLVKIGEVTGREVSVVNNSLLYYDGVNTTNPDLSSRWPTIQSGLISISTDGSNWSPLVDIASNWTIDGTLPQGAEGNKPVWANVIPTGSIAGNPIICPMSIYYRLPPGTITGTVKRNESTPNCNQGVAVERQVTISRTTAPVYSCTLTSTGGNYTTDSCPTKPLQGYTYQVSVAFNQATESCASSSQQCPASSCSQPVSLATSPQTLNFSLFPFKPAWFQTEDGDIHGNGNVWTPIPNTCTGGTCNPYLSLIGAGGTPGVVSSAGSIGVGTFAQAKISETEWEVEDSTGENITGFGSNNTIYGYDYFYEKLGSPTVDNFDGSKPSTSGVYFDDDPSGTVTSTGNWSVSNTEKIVIFVNGNLTINNNKIAVAEGGFLAFIVSGNISVSKSQGVNPQSNAEKYIEGVFIADGSINTIDGVYDKTKKFNASGIFIADANLDGVGGFSFGRNLDVNNDKYPAEYFKFRPDFLVNFPSQMGTRRITWREVAP